MVEQLKADGARSEHVEQFAGYRVPRSDFDAALHALTEIPFRLSRDGRRAAMQAALDNSATWGQIKHWRAGRRSAPQWAVDILKNKLARRHEADERGLKILGSQK
jgi:hypothetical protein